MFDMPTNATPRGAYFAWTPARSGAVFAQNGHHDAQKSTTTSPRPTAGGSPFTQPPGVSGGATSPGWSGPRAGAAAAAGGPTAGGPPEDVDGVVGASGETSRASRVTPRAATGTNAASPAHAGM